MKIIINLNSLGKDIFFALFSLLIIIIVELVKNY